MTQTKLEQAQDKLDRFYEDLESYSGASDRLPLPEVKELLEAKEAVVRAEIEELLDKAGTFGWNSYRDDMNSREFNNELKHYIKSLLAEQ